jgi:hypothetical protein
MHAHCFGRPGPDDGHPREVAFDPAEELLHTVPAGEDEPVVFTCADRGPLEWLDADERELDHLAALGAKELG